MKSSKNFLFTNSCFMMMIFFIGFQLYGMKSTSGFTFKTKTRHGQLTQPMPTGYQTNVVWMTTSDGMIIEMPRWYVDQMVLLQVLFLGQEGKNSKNNPLNASMVTYEQLTLLQMALQNAVNPAKLQLFCNNLTQDERSDLINGATAVQAYGLLSLLMNIIFSPEIQEKLGASVVMQEGVIAPVIHYLQNITDEKIIFKNRNTVSCILFSHDGNFIVSGATGRQHNLMVWDSKTGAQKLDLVGHPLWVKCIAISPQDDLIVSGCSSNVNNLILWDYPFGEKKILIGHDAWLNCVQFSGNGKYIASGANGPEKNLILWDGKTGDLIKMLVGHAAQVNCVAFSPDSDYIISGSNGDDNNLILWNIKTDEKKVLVGHNSSVMCVAFSADGNYIISGAVGEQDNLILWDGKTGALIKKCEGHGKNVLTVAFSPDSNYVVSGSYEEKNNLILWDVKKRELFKVLDGHDTGVNCAVFSPDGDFIASGAFGPQKNLILWDGRMGRLIRIYEGSEKNIRSIAFHPQGISFVSGAFCPQNNLIEFNLSQVRIFNFMATQLNIAQARLLYRLYWGKINNEPVILEKMDLDYQIYLTLPYDVQQVVKKFFPFELVSDIVEKQIQKKMNEYRLSLFYTQATLFSKARKKTHDEKVKAVKDAMQNLDKNSISYQACERLLIELEQEAAF